MGVYPTRLACAPKRTCLSPEERWSGVVEIAQHLARVWYVFAKPEVAFVGHGVVVLLTSPYLHRVFGSKGARPLAVAQFENFAACRNQYPISVYMDPTRLY